MDIISSIFLGIVQGLTEFLPISSSGHLVLFRNLLGFKGPQMLLDTFLHLGTLMAVIIYLRAQLKAMVLEISRWISGLFSGKQPVERASDPSEAALALMVLVGTLPTLLIGLLFRSRIEILFGSVNTVGLTLLVTGVILAVTRLLPGDYNTRLNVGLWTALAVGAAQGLALIPGLSRSGATIVCGLLCGLRRDLATRFSFLLAIPAIVGATALQLSPDSLHRVGLLPLTLGFISSSLVGLIALRILMDMVRRGRLFYFTPYCWVVGMLIVWT